MGAKQLADYLQDAGAIKSKAVYQAFVTVDRKDFVPVAERVFAYQDHALPIGHGQTISQPFTVALMIEQLQIQPGHKVLDIGSGSGWTTALLAYLVGSTGRVIGLERIPELVKMGQRNLAKYKFDWAEIKPAKEQLGLPQEQPFDRILVSAEAQTLPDELIDQLAAPGRLLLPVRDTLTLVDKDAQGHLVTETVPDFRFIFVPLIQRS